MIQLYINNEIADIPDDFVIAITKQFKLVEDFNKIQGDFSNTLVLPYTKANSKIFTNIQDVNCNSALVYENLIIDLFINGTAVIRNGYGVIESITPTGVSVTIYSNVVSFLEITKDATLKDLGITDTLDFTWSNVAALTDYDTESDYAYLIADYANGQGVFNNTTNFTTYAQQLIPSVKCSKVMEFIADKYGYTMDATYFSDTFISLNDIDLKYSAYFNAVFKRRPTDTWITSGSGVKQYLPDEGTGALFWVKDDYEILPYVPDEKSSANGFGFIVPQQGHYKFSIRLVLKNENTTKTFTLKAEGSISISEEESLDFVAGENVVADFVIEFDAPVAGELIRFYLKKYEASGAANAYVRLDVSGRFAENEYESGRRYSTPDRGFIKLESYNIINTAYNKKLSVNSIMPAIKVSDFIKTLCVLNGFILNISDKNKTIGFRSFDEILVNIENGDVDDWTSKILSLKNIDTNIGWAQSNSFLYTPDNEGNVNGIGDGYIVVDNDNLEKDRNVYTSPFSGASHNTLFDGFFYLTGCLQMNYYQFVSSSPISYKYQSKAKPRLFKKELFGSAVQPLIVSDGSNSKTYDDNLTNRASIATFANSRYSLVPKHEAQRLDFPSVLSGEYGKYTTILKMLYWNKRIKISMFLQETDLNRDPLRPVYIQDFNSYFYVNKITNFVEGKPTEVELIKI